MSLSQELEGISLALLIKLGEALLAENVDVKGCGIFDPDCNEGSWGFRKSNTVDKFDSLVTFLMDLLPDYVEFRIAKSDSRLAIFKKWSLMINLAIALELKKVANLRKRRGDVNSERAHNKAADIILLHPHAITCGKEAVQLKGIGPKISKKIDELLETGHIQELEVEAAIDKELNLLKTIWGVNVATAKYWHDMGIRTVQDVKDFADNEDISLTSLQKLGVEHYEDFQAKVDVQEVSQIQKALQKAVGESWEVIVAGSFRRGRLESKDIDVVLIRKGGYEFDSIASEVAMECIENKVELKKASFGPRQFMGLIKVKTGAWKRLDLFFTTADERACSLLAHTGTARYNINMRAAAQELGYLLNEKHLYDHKGDIIPTPTEADVQKALGFEVLEPRDRF